MTTGKPKREPTGTDGKRVRREAAQEAPTQANLTQEPNDPNDLAAVAIYWAQATLKRGRGRPVVPTKRPTLNMHVDADVLKAFKATSVGWQTRINALLREAVESGRVKA